MAQTRAAQRGEGQTELDQAELTIDDMMEYPTRLR